MGWSALRFTVTMSPLPKEEKKMTISVLAIDLAKHVFQLHGVDHSGAVVLRKRLTRTQLLASVQSLPPCTIAMEACSSAHFWGRTFTRVGHTVKLLPPQYVKP